MNYSSSVGSKLKPEVKITFCEAIAREEGFYSLVPTKTRAQRNHNPGNICWGKFAQTHGATAIETIPSGLSETPRFAFFPDNQTGFNCMSSLLEAMYLGLTITAAISKWAPSSENNTPRYIANVCEWTGYTPLTILTSDILKAPILNSEEN